MIGKAYSLALLLIAAVATAQDRNFPVPFAGTAAVANGRGTADTVLTEVLVGEWKVRWPKSGWEATRTINNDGTFTSSDAGAGTWAVVNQTIVLSFRNYEERFELPLKPEGTKVIGWKNRELVATKQDSPKMAAKADIPPSSKAAPAPTSPARVTPARATPPPAAPPLATPKPFVAEATASGIHHITFKARIDSNAWIIIQDGKMFLDSKGGKPAELIMVNSRKWNPGFNRGVSDDFKFGSPLMPFNGKTVSTKLTKSRGSVNVREQPTEANGMKLVIQLEDSAAGPGNFDLLITW